MVLIVVDAFHNVVVSCDAVDVASWLERFD